MFDNEIRGQLATLMGGRAAEELTCGHLSTGESFSHVCTVTNLLFQGLVYTFSFRLWYGVSWKYHGQVPGGGLAFAVKTSDSIKLEDI